MIADHQTNMVFVADTLEPRFPEVFHGLKAILESHRIPLGIIPRTRDIWCRDYLPIQVTEDRFVQFRYAPDYLTGRFRHLRADGEIGPTLPWVATCIRSDITLDGGNVVRSSDTVIMTEKVFDENPLWTRRKLSTELGRLFGTDRLIWIPQEPGDVVGHADGVVRFKDPHTILSNSYAQYESGYGLKLRRIFRRSKLTPVEFPYYPLRRQLRGIPSATGNYVNFLQVAGLIVFPAYDLSEDEYVGRLLISLLPEASVATINCKQVAMHGGALNCISWTAQIRKNRGHQSS